MKHLASRQVLRLSRFGALALGLGLSALAAAPAAADCSAGPMTMSTGPGGPSYTCTRNCDATVTGSRARFIRTESFSGHTATADQCLNACSSTLGCTAVTYDVTVETRDGIPHTRVYCVLFGGGEPSTYDLPPDPRPGRSHGLCYRDPPTGLGSDPRLKIDWRRELGLDQYNLRPGVPGPGVPYSNPKKP